MTHSLSIDGLSKTLLHVLTLHTSNGFARRSLVLTVHCAPKIVRVGAFWGASRRGRCSSTATQLYPLNETRDGYIIVDRKVIKIL
jgi:hypothetical protein